jgi:hypothetical protein
MLISELPNSHTYPLRALAELRAKEFNPGQILLKLESDFDWIETREKGCFWGAVYAGQRPPIPAASIEDLRRAGMMPEPSITLEDYARMEREDEAITSPAHYKVAEGLEVMDIIRAVLTPEQLRGHYIATIIAYRMRAGKKTMSPVEDLGKAHVYEEWLRELEGGEG